MSQYFLFIYDDYYPCGGFDDLAGIFDTEQDALEYLEKNHDDLADDNIELCIIKNNEPELVGNTFYVIDGDGCACFVFGNEDKKTIKLIGRRWALAPSLYSHSSRSMGDFDLRLEKT